MRLIGRSSHHLDMKKLIVRSAYLFVEGQICLLFGYVSNKTPSWEGINQFYIRHMILRPSVCPVSVHCTLSVQPYLWLDCTTTLGLTLCPTLFHQALGRQNLSDKLETVVCLSPNLTQTPKLWKATMYPCVTVTLKFSRYPSKDQSICLWYLIDRYASQLIAPAKSCGCLDPFKTISVFTAEILKTVVVPLQKKNK